MTIVRWEPLRELTSLQADMNRLFNTAFAGPETGSRRWSPPVDLVEKPDHYVLRADLPGMKPEDVALQVEENVLTFSGARKRDTDGEASAYHHAERTFGAFARAIALPAGVDADGVDASFADGVLEIRIPKPEQAKPRRVAISVGERQTAVAA